VVIRREAEGGGVRSEGAVISGWRLRERERGGLRGVIRKEAEGGEVIREAEGESSGGRLREREVQLICRNVPHPLTLQTTDNYHFGGFLIR
jgi:hypothetical protein